MSISRAFFFTAAHAGAFRADEWSETSAAFLGATATGFAGLSAGFGTGTTFFIGLRGAFEAARGFGCAGAAAGVPSATGSMYVPRNASKDARPAPIVIARQKYITK